MHECTDKEFYEDGTFPDDADLPRAIDPRDPLPKRVREMLYTDTFEDGEPTPDEWQAIREGLQAYLAMVDERDEAVQRLYRCVEAEVKYFDDLKRHSIPDDPINVAREVYHGTRISEARAALEACKHMSK